MTHAALLELLTEGYIVFRRVLSITSSIGDSSSLPAREKARYQLVESDSAYLYLLGKSYLEAIYKTPPPFDLSLCVLISIDDTLSAVSNYDAGAVIIEFARQLGLNAQESDPSFASKLEDVLSRANVVEHSDPVMQLAFDGSNSLDARSVSILTKLNVPLSSWDRIVAATANDSLMLHWRKALNKAASLRVHKSNLFISLVYAAAQAVDSKFVSDIELSGGKDALVLAAPVVLSFERRSLQYPSKLKPIPMLTTAMVNAYSDHVMTSRDYVRTTSGTWEPKDRVVEALPGNDVKYVLASPRQPAEQSTPANASAMVIGAIRSSISKKAKSEATLVAERVGKSMQASALRWLRKKNIKF